MVNWFASGPCPVFFLALLPPCTCHIGSMFSSFLVFPTNFQSKKLSVGTWMLSDAVASLPPPRLRGPNFFCRELNKKQTNERIVGRPIPSHLFLVQCGPIHGHTLCQSLMTPFHCFAGSDLPRKRGRSRLQRILNSEEALWLSNSLKKFAQ